MTTTLNITELEKLARAADTINPGEWISLRHASESMDDDSAALVHAANPQTILTLISALREAKRALTEDDYCKCEYDRFHPEEKVECVRCKTLHSIAGKVEGL